ncbi:MAG TPA: YbaB/EbfC family nucleoid-associated protein [Actinophytocola sp.]|nr:YbaB/EbfC family nucleoid-associated protein [Actinophytocola sp.]
MAEIDIDHEMAVVDRRVRQASDRAAAEVARVKRISGRATSPDGTISAEVAPGGLLTDLQLTPAALQVDMETLARRIMSVTERATRLAGGNMHKALAPVVGDRDLESLGYVPVDDEEADTDPDAAFADPLKHGGTERGRRRP